MKFSPTKAELQSSHSDLPSSPSDLMNPDLYVSGSKWGAIHLKALRVVSWDDMEISKLIPSKYLPHHNSKVFREWKQAVTEISREQLQQWDIIHQQYEGHKFKEFFNHLHDAMRKERDTWTTPSEAAPAARGGTPASQESHSSLEHQPEMPSRLAMQYFMLPLAQARSNGSKKGGIKVEFQDTPLEIPLGPQGSRPALKHAINDGGMSFFEKLGMTGGHSSMGSIPAVSFEAKRRHVGGKHRATHEEEDYNAKSLAQEVAELLAMALANFNSKHSTKGDQEAYLITIHGTRFRVTTAYFTAEYLRHVQSASMPPNQHLYVWRSRHFELKNPDGRANTLLAAMGLINYLFSGDAVMEQVKQISRELKKDN